MLQPEAEGEAGAIGLRIADFAEEHRAIPVDADQSAGGKGNGGEHAKTAARDIRDFHRDGMGMRGLGVAQRTQGGFCGVLRGRHPDFGALIGR